MSGSLRRLSLVLGAVLAGALAGASVAQEPQHFNPKGKMPLRYTVEAQQQQRRILPLADRQDFQEAKRGFIAAPSYRRIMNDEGGVAWDYIDCSQRRTRLAWLKERWEAQRIALTDFAENTDKRMRDHGSKAGGTAGFQNHKSCIRSIIPALCSARPAGGGSGGYRGRSSRPDRSARCMPAERRRRRSGAP